MLDAADPKHQSAARQESEILDEGERARVLVEFNQTASPYPHDVCIQRLFEEQVERTPDRIALTFENRNLTYAQLNARANQVAHYLRSRGVVRKCRWRFAWSGVSRWSSRFWASSRRGAFTCISIRLTQGAADIRSGKRSGASTLDDGTVARAHAG